MKDIKFRQYVNNGGFHHWGFLKDDVYVGPAHIFGGTNLTPSQQFTGLKDRDDNEIYEGDIVEYTDEDGTKEVGEVLMFRYEWGLDNDKGFHPFVYQVQRADVDYHRVLGNIYENPELLPGGKL